MKLIAGLSRMWCQAMHPSPMWPVNGQYRCPECLRVYPVAWESTAAASTTATETQPRMAASLQYTPAHHALKTAPAVAVVK